MALKILMVAAECDQALFSEALEQKLQYQLVYAKNASMAYRLLNEETSGGYSLVILDTRTLGQKALELIRGLRSLHPNTPVITLISYANDAYANDVLQAGASDFVVMPVSFERLKHSLRLVMQIRSMAKYMGWLERKLSGSMDFSDIVGSHPKLTEMLATARKAASSKIPIWIEGQGGTEIELLARAIHGGSGRANKRFIAVNCRMLSPNYAEGLLFGEQHDPDQAMIGKIREAEGGTLYLEEVLDLPEGAKAQLLHFLETGTIMPIGSATPIKLDVRLICSHTQSGVELNATPRKHSILLSRLRSVVLAIPPLAERRSDIPAIAEYWLAHHAASEMKPVETISAQALDWLSKQSWPGNVHQLSDAIWRAVCQARLPILNLEDFLDTNRHTIQASPQPMLTDDNGKVKTLRLLQEEAIRFALHYSGGCMTRAAKCLGIGRSTLYRKLEEHQISRANQTTRPMMTVSAAERSKVEY